MSSPYHTVLYMLLLLLPASLIAAEQINIEAKFFESSKGVMPHDLAKLAQAKGIDLLSAPRVTTKSGQQAQIEVICEHQPASVAPSAFEPVPIGITVRITPQLNGNRISYTAQLTISELVASKASDRQTLSEITSRDIYVSSTPKEGEDVWLDFTAPGNGKESLSGSTSIMKFSNQLAEKVVVRHKGCAGCNLASHLI